MNKIIIAFVGMPGAGKSEAASYLAKKGIPFVRFGEITDQGLIKEGLPLSAENEQLFREKLRREYGMAAYAIASEAKIEELLKKNDTLAIDGLYSWEEYTYLKQKHEGLMIVHIYAEPPIRYKRLAKRSIRSLTASEARRRDIMEIEKLNKGGPIAIADYMIEDNSDISHLHKRIDELLERLQTQ